MEKKNWHWAEVPFIPDGVDGQNLLRFQGHIFVKSNIVRDLKAKENLKSGREKDRRRGRDEGLSCHFFLRQLFAYFILMIG